MNIENESAIISLERLKELEETFAEVDKIKEDYKTKSEALRVVVSSATNYYSYSSSLDFVFSTIYVNSDEVTDEIKSRVEKINFHNTKHIKDLKKKFSELANKYNNMPWYKRVLFVFSPNKYNIWSK